LGIYEVDKLMAETRRLAAEYRKTTGQALGVSGEIAEYDAARLLGLELCNDPAVGCDAIGQGEREGKRIQIKGRVIFDESKSGHRIGQLKLEKDWDSLLLVLMDDNYDPVEIYEADREEIIDAIEGSASEKRSKRGAMSVAKFKIIGHLVWNSEEGEVDDEVWDNQSGS
jgi:hypothetical protein